MTGDSQATVPPFDGTPRTIGIIKKAAKNLQRSLSLSRQADQFRDWAEENAGRLQARSFPLDKQRWTDFANRSVSYVTNEPDLPRLAWHWFFEVHRHAIEETWLTTPHASPAIPNALVPTLHAFLSPGAETLNLERLQKLEGFYAAYRPSFANPEQVMVMAMQCGIDGDMSRFSIAMKYIDDDDEDKNEYAEGFALPYQDSVLFQGRLTKAASPFIFILSEFPNEDGKISQSSGALLVGASGVRSSAYPIVIRRVAEPVSPECFDIESFKKSRHAHRAVLPVMARGLVGWR